MKWNLNHEHLLQPNGLMSVDRPADHFSDSNFNQYEIFNNRTWNGNGS